MGSQLMGWSLNGTYTEVRGCVIWIYCGLCHFSRVSPRIVKSCACHLLELCSGMHCASLLSTT